MSAPHLLSLADLHATAPGVLDVIFGADGDFEGAPVWRCPIWYTYGRPKWCLMRAGYWCVRLDGRGHWVALADQIGHIRSCHLDLRIPSIAARLAGLCCRAANPLRMLDSWQRAADLASRASRGEWDPEYAPALAALTLALAPRIAALGGARG